MVRSCCGKRRPKRRGRKRRRRRRWRIKRRRAGEETSTTGSRSSCAKWAVSAEPRHEACGCRRRLQHLHPAPFPAHCQPVALRGRVKRRCIIIRRARARLLVMWGRRHQHGAMGNAPCLWRRGRRALEEGSATRRHDFQQGGPRWRWWC